MSVFEIKVLEKKEHMMLVEVSGQKLTIEPDMYGEFGEFGNYEVGETYKIISVKDRTPVHS